MLNALDLFSNVGCHALGLARAGIRTIGFCEIDGWRRIVLQRRFPGIRVHDDVRAFEGIPANIIIGGPPCQETSVAAAIHGKRSGESLWPHMPRIGVNVGADWIVVEQPPGHAKWEAAVAQGLSDAGYHVGRFEFGACDVGAPYLRRRVFLVACSSLPRLALARSALPSAIEAVKRAANARGDWSPDQLATLRVDARSVGEMDGRRDICGVSWLRRARITALGDSNPPHMAEVIGRAILEAEHKG